MLCYFHDNRNGDERILLWCATPPGVEDELVTAEPHRSFRPTPSASGTFSTWLGVYVDTTDADTVDWTEISNILDEAYRTVAPTRLVKQLDNRTPARRRDHPRKR